MTRREILRGMLATLGLGCTSSAMGASGAGRAGIEPLSAKHPAVKDAIEADVVVVGAGASGIPAAVAAARCGAKVVLLEDDMVIGGAPVDMYVTYLCGNPRRGVYKEATEELNRHHDLTGKPIENFRVGNNGPDHWYLPSSYTAVSTRIVQAEKSIRLITGARITNAIVSEGSPRNKVHGVVYSGPNGEPRCVMGKVIIDATGTGLVAERAGCKVLYGRDAASDFNEQFAPEKADNTVMNCTWMFISQRYLPGPAIDPKALKVGSMVESNAGWCALDVEGYQKRNSGIYLHWGSTVQCKDTRDPQAIGEAQTAALNRVERDIAVLMENGYAVHFAPKLGVRESRRVVGEHMITMNDQKAGLMPEDTIAHADYYLDVWGQELTEEEKRLPLYGIPYRALIPKDTEGLLVAGKSISGTHIAMSSYRVQPIVSCIGQAAGVAAAMAAQRFIGVRNVPMNQLQTKLREMQTTSFMRKQGAEPCFDLLDSRGNRRHFLRRAQLGSSAH